MDREYLPISGAVFFVLGLTWTKRDWTNLLVKLVLLGMFAWVALQYVRGQ